MSKSKRIIMWHLPRSASTSLAQQLSIQTDITNHNEIFGSWRTDADRHEILSQDEFIVKVNSEQYLKHKELIDSVITSCTVIILEPRSYLDSYSSWLLPSTMMKYATERNKYWNIHWGDYGGPTSPEEMKNNYDGYTVNFDDAMEEITHYSRLVDLWIEHMPMFAANGEVFKQHDVDPSFGKIWDSVAEKTNKFENPLEVIEEIDRQGARRWSQLKELM
jgi:hypothetical protein